MANGTSRGGGGYGRPHRIAPALFALFAAAGCYRYVPVETGAAPPGADVRIEVTRGVPLTVGAVPLDTHGANIVRGRLVSTPVVDTLLCDVLLETSVNGAPSRGLRGTVSIPIGAVERVEVRSLDRLRTGGLIGGSALLAWLIVDNAFDIHNGREGTDGHGGTDNARITIFRLRW